MAAYVKVGERLYVGAIADTKPASGVRFGTRCYEYDSNKWYITYNHGANWVEMQDLNALILGAGDANIGNVDIVTLPSGNLGQQAKAASLSVAPATDITDATYIGDIKFGEALPAGTALLGKVGIDQTTPGTTNAVQEVPAGTFAHTSKTTNAATAVQLAANQACREALVTAKPGNTGWVYVGGSTVSSASYGRRLGAGQSIVLAVNNLNLVWIDVSVNGEGVDILYVA